MISVSSRVPLLEEAAQESRGFSRWIRLNLELSSPQLGAAWSRSLESVRGSGWFKPLNTSQCAPAVAIQRLVPRFHGSGAWLREAKVGYKASRNRASRRPRWASGGDQLVKDFAPEYFGNFHPNFPGVLFSSVFDFVVVMGYTKYPCYRSEQNHGSNCPLGRLWCQSYTSGFVPLDSWGGFLL